MFEQVSGVLDGALDELEIPVDRAALRWCFSFLDRFSAKLTAALAAFDDAGAWRDVGATSMTAWLRHQVGLSGREASRWARTARRLAGLPVTAKAYEEGVLSGGQVQAIVANLNDQTAGLFAEVEHELVPQLARLGAKDAGNVMQAWATVAKDHLQPDPAEDHNGPDDSDGPERSLHLSETLDGRGELSGSLDPEGRALADTALRLADSPDADGEPARTPARRRADALLDIFQFFLDNQTGHAGGRHRPHLNVIVDYEDLVGERPGRHGGSEPDAPNQPAHAHASDAGADAARNPVCGDSHATGGGPGVTGAAGISGTANGSSLGDLREVFFPYSSGLRGGGRLLDGTVLDAATIRRLACDAGVHRVVMAGRSSILDYGWTTRTIPVNLWAALVARDHHCRFPGCDRPAKWCDGHHVVPWEKGGPTRLANLALFCRRHHHLLHSPGWDAELQPDGIIEITDPKGQVRTTDPPGRHADLFTQRPPPAERPAA